MAIGLGDGGAHTVEIATRMRVSVQSLLKTLKLWPRWSGAEERGESFVHGESGFKMVDIIVVVSIMTLLAAISVPVVYKWSSSIRFREATLGIASDLKLGRATAVTAKREARVEFDLQGRRYRLTQGNLPLGSTAWSVVKPWEGLYSDVELGTGSGCTGGAETHIRFKPNGSSDGGEICIKDGTGAERFKIVVSSISGRVKVK